MPYLLYTSPKVPPHNRFLKRPSAHWCPSQSSNPPVTIPGTNTTGCFARKPSFCNLIPGGSGKGPVIASVTYCGNEAGIALYRKSKNHQVEHTKPIHQQQVSKQEHLPLPRLTEFVTGTGTGASLLPLILSASDSCACTGTGGRFLSSDGFRRLSKDMAGGDKSDLGKPQNPSIENGLFNSLALGGTLCSWFYREWGSIELLPREREGHKGVA